MTRYPRHALPAVLLALAASACGPDPYDGPTDADAVQARAEQHQAPRRPTGAEIQDRALNRIVRAVYLCENGERLSVDFDNPRGMATVRNSLGEAVDLRQERAASGIWYLASGHELRGQGTEATWTADGREPTACRAVD
jgi:membrane-bound inhibitor of C-type lysozyme